MLKKLVSVALPSLLLAAFGSSAAPIVNGRFETGTFNGCWGGVTLGTPIPTRAADGTGSA